MKSAVGWLFLLVGGTAGVLLVLQHLGGLALPGWSGAEGRWLWWFAEVAYLAGAAAAWVTVRRCGMPSSLRHVVRAAAIVAGTELLFLALPPPVDPYEATCLGACVGFWAVAEWKRRPRVPTLQPVLTLVAVFALVAAALNVVRSDRDRALAKRLRTQTRASQTALAEEATAPTLGRREALTHPTSAGGAEVAPPRDGEKGMDAEGLSGSGDRHTVGQRQALARPTSLGQTPSSNRPPDGGRPYRWGPADAAVRLVIFSDYQCEKCRRIERDVQTLVQRFPEAVSVTLRHYPRCRDCNPGLKVNTHPQACEAARAAEAAGRLKGPQGFWQMHAWLFKRQGLFTDTELAAGLSDLGYDDPEEFRRTMLDPAALQGILDDIVEAQVLRIDSTPLILINGIQLRAWEAENALARAVQDLVDRRATPSDRSATSPESAEQAAPANDRVSRVPQDTALWATVRIENADGWSVGSGAIVGSRSPFVYVLTAKHVVAAAGRLRVQTFEPTTFPHPANVYRSVEVLAQAADLDLAVVRVTTNVPPPGTIRICPPESIPRDVGVLVRAVGCLPEEGLTAWSTRILGKRLVRHRSDGAAEWLWEVDRMPEKGVSGGPLLDDRGYLIGIAGGVSDGRGYYCHAAGIHRFLKVNGLKWLFSG